MLSDNVQNVLNALYSQSLMFRLKKKSCIVSGYNNSKLRKNSSNPNLNSPLSIQCTVCLKYHRLIGHMSLGFGLEQRSIAFLNELYRQYLDICIRINLIYMSLSSSKIRHLGASLMIQSSQNLAYLWLRN